MCFCHMALYLSKVHGQPSLGSAHILFWLCWEKSRPVFQAKKTKIKETDLLFLYHIEIFILFF
jgi:hypothetical protein